MFWIHGHTFFKKISITFQKCISGVQWVWEFPPFLARVHEPLFFGVVVFKFLLTCNSHAIKFTKLNGSDIFRVLSNYHHNLSLKPFCHSHPPRNPLAIRSQFPVASHLQLRSIPLECDPYSQPPRHSSLHSGTIELHILDIPINGIATGKNKCDSILDLPLTFNLCALLLLLQVNHQRDVDCSLKYASPGTLPPMPEH